MSPSDPIPAPGGQDPKLLALLARLLAASPEEYGYATYHGRFGWTIPKLRRCLEEHFDVRLPRSTMRRALSQLGCVWEHKSFTRTR
ncbi:MAG TPA: hypothetical protein VHG51_07620 [Longimicrobiaceae bacterium]|nr:hypothetical protein [Longimicrobiaceae bacterium]